MFARGRLGVILAGMLLCSLVAMPASVAAAGTSDAGGVEAIATDGTHTDAGGAVRDATVSKSVTAMDGKTVISGQVQYEGTGGSLKPARQVTVKIRHDVVGPANPVLATTTTDDSGHYQVAIDVSEHESEIDMEDWNTPDKTLHLHVQAVAKNPAVNVVNLAENIETANGNTWTINKETSVERGQGSATFDLTARDRKPRRAFQIANWTLEGYRFTERKADWTRSRVNVLYPAPNPDTNQYQSPFDKFVIGDNNWDADKRHTVHHEYGHAVMSGLYGYSGWQIPKPENWGPHCVWSDTGRINAFYEGFAEFFEAAVADDPSMDGMYLEKHHYYNESIDHGPQCPESHANDGYDGAKVEGAVANVLWDAYDPANEPHDDIDGSLKTVFDAVDEKDNQATSARPLNSDRTTDVHDFFIQYTDNTGRYEELRKLYFEYGIVKPDRFDSHPGTYAGPMDCTVHNYPCSMQSTNDWTTLQPDASESVDAILHGHDDDSYVIHVRKGDRINVTVTDRAGAAEPTLDLVLGSPPWNSQTPRPQPFGSPTRNGDVVYQEFSADTTGAYTIEVDNRNSGDNVGTYTVSVENTTQSGSDGFVGYQPEVIPEGEIRVEDTPDPIEIPEEIPNGSVNDDGADTNDSSNGTDSGSDSSTDGANESNSGSGTTADSSADGTSSDSGTTASGSASGTSSSTNTASGSNTNTASGSNTNTASGSNTNTASGSGTTTASGSSTTTASESSGSSSGSAGASGATGGSSAGTAAGSSDSSADADGSSSESSGAASEGASEPDASAKADAPETESGDERTETTTVGGDDEYDASGDAAADTGGDDGSEPAADDSGESDSGGGDGGLGSFWMAALAMLLGVVVALLVVQRR